MENTSNEVVLSILHDQKDFVRTGETKDYKYRIESLVKLKQVILKNEKRIADALWADLHKSYEEAYLTEISIVLHEIDNHLKHLKKWMRVQKVRTPIHLLPSVSRLVYEPLGTTLIIAPWNYPFQLLINPLVGAISAGCCAILKPSPYTANIAKLMEEMLQEVFSKKYIAVVQGNRDVNQFLLSQRFDLIFFTGSPSLGKEVMKAASQYLTPVVLELGGKSPCIVASDANIDVAAKRIAWGKFINAGQTCIAPDYLLVHQSVKEELLGKIIQAVENMYGVDVKRSRYYPRIVTRQAVERIEKLMKHGNVVYGGEIDVENLYISPTIIDHVEVEYPVMHEEIFGPVLPVITYTNLIEALNYVNYNEKPLAFYYFGKASQARDVLKNSSSGGVCINDTLMHIANDRLPFGGVGNSGMNKYHGFNSFLVFSNARSIVKTPTWIDIAFRYPPYRNFKLTRKII